MASRVTEKYGLPSIFISFDGATRGYPAADDIGKGSGRSIKGMNLVEALNYCSEYLVKTFPNLRTIGMDFLSIGTPANDLSADAHQMLLGCYTEHYITGIEDMDLEAAEDKKIKSAVVAPLRIVGADSGQVCVIAELED